MRVGLAAWDGVSRFCVLRGDRALDVAGLARARGVDHPEHLGEFLGAGPAARERLAELCDTPAADDEGLSVPVADAVLQAPLVPGAKILCHVVNYLEHGAEANVEPPERPFFFYKPASAVVGPHDPIVAHRWSSEMDYEVELAAVVGTAGRDILAGEAYDHIAGYVVLNDVSYRDLQFNRAAPSLGARFGQNWTQGKGLDGSCPFGPWITLSDEVADPYPLRISAWVDGALRQDASTEQQIFRLPELVQSISRGMTLHPGDVIATGTPAGSAVGDQTYLRAGQTVRCEIERLGALVNEVVAG